MQIPSFSKVMKLILRRYFVSAIQAYVPKETNSLIILGDSITDGRGSDDNKNNRFVSSNSCTQLRSDEYVAGLISFSKDSKQVK